MNKLLFATLPLCFLAPVMSWANDYKTTVEYRHEYLDGKKSHGDRYKVYLDTGQHIGFEFDARYGNEDEEAFNRMYLNGSELNAFYYTNLNKNTVFLAGNSFDFTDDGVVYIPFVRLNYNFDNGFRINGRYKWKIWDYAMNGDNNQPYHSRIQEFDSWVGYKWGDWDFEYEFDIFKEMASNGQPLYDNKDWDYAHNVKVTYSINKNWRPFVEVGNVKQNNYSDDRQTRFRVGIKYTW
ncbi:oligogalacturonate-specific porin KdgM family protein [Kluyvera sp. CHPC 1.251]|uniref:oligogalacturonate-specific porin KdgM family protein n=1 Tax=Kluyvera sp. CHPC 1.251 TaxID=2995175 RepID=UPI002FD84AD5